MRSITAVVLTLLLLAPSALRAQIPRDNRLLPGAGTAAISGVVLSDEREPRPLRRARVSLTGVQLEVGRMAITADDGTFRFEQLPVGRYSLSAAKAGYVTMSVGAERPGRAGTGVEVRADETARATIRLPKGAVITGIVNLPSGEPAGGVTVLPLVQRYVPTAGERRTTVVPNSTVVTDDRGVYRIFGLPPGTYMISALPRSGPIGPTTRAEIQVLSDEEIRRALSEVREQTIAARPGMLSAPAAATAAATLPRSSVALAPIYYPGTVTERQAATISVAAGEVRSGIDIDLEFVRTANVEGYVTAPPGTRVHLMLANADGTSAGQGVRVTAIPGADGRFVFRALPPGHYEITARALPVETRTRATPAQSIAWGRTEVILTGEDVSGLAIALKPSLTISGTVAFDGDRPPPPLPSVRLPIPAITGDGALTTLLPSVVAEGNRFTIAGALPGTYRFQTLLQGVRAPIAGWWLQSIVVRDKELLDAPWHLQESAEDAVITFSDRASELSGFVRYTSGGPFREGLVVVFGGDRGTWFLNSRRVAAVQPSADGRYVVHNLPPGKYYVSVAIGLERNEWFDPEVLASLAADAPAVRIEGREAKTQDLVLSR